jgi:hypothetical protein
VNLDRATVREVAALRGEPGTNARPETPNQGVIPAATAGSIEVEVDGLPATNVTGWPLPVGLKVRTQTLQGAIYVTGVFAILGGS